MTPLSVVTRVAAGLRQNKAKIRSVVWPLILSMSYLHEPNPAPHTLVLRIPDHDPCPLSLSGRDSFKSPLKALWPSSPSPHPPFPLPLILWPEIAAPGKEKGREDFKVSARYVPRVDDLLHV